MTAPASTLCICFGSPIRDDLEAVRLLRAQQVIELARAEQPQLVDHDDGLLGPSWTRPVSTDFRKLSTARVFLAVMPASARSSD